MQRQKETRRQTGRQADTLADTQTHTESDRARDTGEGERAQMSGLYWKEPLEEGKPSFWAEKFRVKDGLC